MPATMHVDDRTDAVGLRGPGPLRVLVGLDASDTSLTALALVDGLEWPAASEIRVIEAIDDRVPALAAPWPIYGHFEWPDPDAAAGEEAERALAASAAQLDGPSRTVTSEVARGSVAASINERAAAFDADLVVVGSHGRGPIASKLLGSVSAELAIDPPAPLLIARKPTVERVLIAWDGSSASARAAEVFLGSPLSTDTIVRVTGVAPAGHDWAAGVRRRPASRDARLDRDNGSPIDTALIEAMASRVRSQGRPTRTDLRYGDPGHEIVAAASAWRADLIVMGTHGRRGLEYLLLGSVARHVIGAAPCSVLIARA